MPWSGSEGDHISIHCRPIAVDLITMYFLLYATVIATCYIVLTIAQSAIESPIGPPAYTVSAGFPTSAFSSYYIPPTATEEPQPALHDPVLNITYPLNLTNPDTIPDTDDDPIFYPRPAVNVSNATATSIVQAAIANITAIIQSPASSNCTKCQDALLVAKNVAQTTPHSVPDMLVTLCEKFKFKSNSSCVENYAATNYGAIWTQVLAFATVDGLDGRYICNLLSSTFCSRPRTTPLNTTGLFPKPKPENAAAPKPSGKRVKVLHLSDFHLDPRYAVASEANCSSGLCCRTNVHADGLTLPQVELPAPLYGAYRCDTPYYLA